MTTDRFINCTTGRRVAFTWCLLVLLNISAFFSVAYSQDPDAPTPQPSPEVRPEEDPTKPVLISIRNEYRNLKNEAWANTVIFRVDKLSFRNFKNKGGARGLIFRVDIPFNTVHSGTVTKSGLGDLYTQVLYLPRVRKKFVFALGSGLVIPTATHNLLGQGKLVVAPTAIPVWYFAKRKRFALIRFQNYISVAGKRSRPDVNYFIADPTIVHALNKKWWVTANTEFKWDWRTKRGSGISGFQIGRMVRGKFGFG